MKKVIWKICGGGFLAALLGCMHPIPASTTPDTAKLVACLAGEVAKGNFDPLAAALACGAQATQEIQDIVHAIVGAQKAGAARCAGAK